MGTPPGSDRPPLHRPRLLAISGWREGAPVMHLAWPGTPTLWNAVCLRTPDKTLRGCRINAGLELSTMTREQLQLLREVAKPGPPPHPGAIPGASWLGGAWPMIAVGVDIRRVDG